MATRVNTKLLIIVSTCSVIAVAVVGFVWAQQYRADPTRFLKAGDAAMARNDYAEAARNYGRAIGKRPSEVSYHTKYLEASKKIVPKSIEEARESYLLYVGSLLRRAQLAKTDEPFWREVLNERHMQSELNDSAAGWKALYDVANLEMLELLDEDDALTSTAKAYMGYSQARRYTALSPDEISAAIATLEESLEKAQGVDRDIAYGGLLTIRFEQAATLQRSNQTRLTGEAWKIFDTLLDKASAEVPTGFQIQKLALQRLRQRASSNDPNVNPAMIEAAADKLTARALELGDPVSVFEASKSVGVQFVPKGLERAAALLTAFLAKQPDAIIHRRALAYCLQGIDPVTAEREANAIIDAPQLPVSLASASQDETRVAAAQQLFDLDFSRMGEELSANERQSLLTKLEASAQRIRTLGAGLADDSIVLKTDGKLAFAKGDYNNADVKFKEVFRKGSLIDVELYVLAAATAEQRGETGQAQQLVEKGLELAPGSVRLLERAASLALRNGRFAFARTASESVLAAEPENKRAKGIRDAAIRGENPTVIDPTDPIVQQLKLADDLRAKRDIEGARKVAKPLLDANPDDVRVIIVNVIVEAEAKNNELALKLADRGLELSPGNPVLSSLRSMLIGGDSPAKRLEASIANDYPNEPDRTIWTAIRMTQLANRTAEEVKRLELSDPTESARQAGLLPGIQAAAEEWRAKAATADPTHPAWLDYLFTAALLDKKFPEAEKIIADAERSGRSVSLVSLFRGRLALVQGRAGEAVTLLQKSIDTNVDDADVFRLLGVAQEQTGDLPAALKSYAEAYRRKPTDLTSAKTYISALVKAGDRATGLAILRDIRKIAPEDQDVMETWLDLEAEIGDRRSARGMRAARYEIVSTDRRNAIKYATMLAELQPEREDVADAAGKVKYTEPAWRGLDERTRQTELERVRRLWRDDSDAIFKQLIANEPLSMELAMLRSSTFRRQGRYAEAETTLRDLIKNAGDKAIPQMHVALGVHFFEVGDLPKAKAAFDDAIRVQDDAKRDGDVAIAEYFFQKGEWQRAVESLERVAARLSNKGLSLRMAEAYGRVGRFEDARKRLAEATADGSRDLVVDQLEGSLAEGEGNQLAAQGKTAEAEQAYNRGLAALDKAAASVPSNATIAVQQASLHRKKFDATGNQASLDAALAAAERATRLRGDFWPAAQAKSDLLLAKGRPNEAVLELERFVKASPSTAEGRRRLIELLAGIGNANRAIEVAREAVSLSPNDPQWRVALAKVYLASDQLDNAISAYEQADRLRPSIEHLAAVTDLRLRKSPPDWQQVLAALREREDDVKRSPYLQSAIGAALANTGDIRNGLEVLRSSYRAAYDAIASGVSPTLIDTWFTNLRLVYPVSRTADAEKFIYEISGNKPTTRDLRWLAEMWYAAGGEGASKAIEFAEKGLAADDKKDRIITARLNDILGSIRYVQGDCKAGLAAFGRAMEALPDEPSVLNNFAYLAGECGDDPKAGVAAAERATRLAPGQPEYLDTLGFVMGKAGRKEEALQVLNESIRIAPSASAHFHLAQILLDMGQKDDARTHIRAAGDLNKDPSLQKQIDALITKLN